MNFRPGLLPSQAGVLEPWAEKDWPTNINQGRGWPQNVRVFPLLPNPPGAWESLWNCPSSFLNSSVLPPSLRPAWKLSKQLRKMKPACLGLCSRLILASYEISTLRNSLCLNLFGCKLGIQYLADWLWEVNTGHALGIVHTTLSYITKMSAPWGQESLCICALFFRTVYGVPRSWMNGGRNVEKCGACFSSVPGLLSSLFSPCCPLPALGNLSLVSERSFFF